MSKTVAQFSHHQPSAKKKKSTPTKYDEDRPLRGKVFFLDLPGYKHTDAIERKLVQRGATVDTFFHSGVKYLVTCRHKTLGKKGDTAPTTSQSSNKSLGAGGQLGVPSPSSDSSKSKSVPVAYGTRAAKMLAASLEKQGAKSNEADLLKVARRFGTRVISLEELLKELRKFKSLPVAKENKNSKDRKHYKVTKLKKVFMKIEDNSGAYRPLVFEAEAWPLPLVGCSANACPYDLPRGSGRSRVAQPSRATGARLTQELPVSLREVSAPTAGTTTTAVIKKRPGYCECCSVRYEDLKMHLKSKKHLDYSNNPANFATLDALVEEGGYSYPQFLERMKHQQHHHHHHHQQQQQQNCEVTEDTVVLLTPPSSPPVTASTPANVGSNKISISISSTNA